MPWFVLRAEDPKTGEVKGYARRTRLEKERKRATGYMSPSTMRIGLLGAQGRFPQWTWRVYSWDDKLETAPLEVAKVVKQVFTRAEVRAMLMEEREACAKMCEDEERIRTQAGQRHPEDSESRDRCFAAARAANNCAIAIRNEMPPVLEGK